MNTPRMLLLTSLLILTSSGLSAPQGDLQVCKLEGLQEIERHNDEVGVAVSTTAWNPGSQPLDWHASPDSRHPFIAQAMYRWADDRLTQIGIAGVKHGYYVAAASGCGQTCTNSASNVLYKNCSDTYGATLNANQNRMGPRFEVNPYTGAWDYSTSHFAESHSHGPLDHLLRVRHTDLQPTAGSAVKYFVEAFYIHYQNADPNSAAAWSQVEVERNQPKWKFVHGSAPGTAGPGFALNASNWPGLRLSELAQALPVVRGQSPDGRARLGSRALQLPDGRWRYDYALLNVDMDRQIAGFTVPIPNGTTLSEVKFFAPEQPDETKSGVGGSVTRDVPWEPTTSTTSITWSTTANPLRWGVMYNFSFVTAAPPADGTVTVQLFKPGGVRTVDGAAQVPGRLEQTTRVSPMPLHRSFVSKMDMMARRDEMGQRAFNTRTLAAPGAMTINEHGDQCATEIGPVPPFNCLDGAVIPITVNGSTLAPNAYTPHMKCDTPIQLGLRDDGQCVPHARLGRLPGVDSRGHPDPDVQWAYICRRYKVRADPAYPLFEDVAIIGHRASTGATCFFQMLDPESPKDARRVPPPTERAMNTPVGHISAEQFWLHPSKTARIGCNNCHDSDPWIHTPYVDQVRGADPTEPLVPAAPRIEQAMKYRFVGSHYFTEWAAPQHFVPRNNECVACHRIGVHQSSRQFTESAAGIELSHRTAWSLSYPRSHWMPPHDQAGAADLARWKQLYEQSVDQIRSCGVNPDQPACNRQAINQ